MTSSLISSSDPWRPTETGIILGIRVTPRGGRDAVDGVVVLADGRALLGVRVRSAAEDRAANRAVILLLAKLLRIAKRDLQILSGQTGRVKQISISGDIATLTARLHGEISRPDGG